MKYFLIYVPMAITAMSLMVGCEREGPAEKDGKKVNEAGKEVKEETQQKK